MGKIVAGLFEVVGATDEIPALQKDLGDFSFEELIRGVAPRRQGLGIKHRSTNGLIGRAIEKIHIEPHIFDMTDRDPGTRSVTNILIIRLKAVHRFSLTGRDNCGMRKSVGPI